MTSRIVAPSLDHVEGKPLKCGLRRTSESFVRAGRLVDQAIARAARTREQAAEEYGVSPSLLARQIQNEDHQHLSFQRLWSMPDDFKAEFVLLLLTDLGIPVKFQAEFPVRRHA